MLDNPNPTYSIRLEQCCGFGNEPETWQVYTIGRDGCRKRLFEGDMSDAEFFANDLSKLQRATIALICGD